MDIRPPWYALFLGVLACTTLGSAVALAEPPLPTAESFRATAPAPPPTKTLGRHNVEVVQQDDATSDTKPNQQHDKQDRAKNAGVVEGEVVSVDYQRGTINLLTPSRGRVDVTVLPSTNIQGRGDSFHTIADISRGSRLRVFLSQRAGQFFAQFIHLR